jgi:hypothetical protein
LPRFGAIFVLKGTAFRCFILDPVPDVPLVRLWGSIGTRIPIWEISKLWEIWFVCTDGSYTVCTILDASRIMIYRT